MLGLNRDWIKKQGDFFVELEISLKLTTPFRWKVTT
jgi:hypothetical protein